MRLVCRSFADGARIPPRFAAAVPGPAGPVPGPNSSPSLEWSDAPARTRSYALLCRDLDAPATFADANRRDRVVCWNAARSDFFHWVLVDIPLSVRHLPEGIESDGFVPKGKPLGKTAHGRRGANGCGTRFAGDPALAGEYGGWDGPWPPFNDERVHRYLLTLYALDVSALELPERFDASATLAAMEGHVLDRASWAGTYTLNPDAWASPRLHHA